MAIIRPILNIGEDQYLCEEPEPHSTDLCLTSEGLLKQWFEGVEFIDGLPKYLVEQGMSKEMRNLGHFNVCSWVREDKALSEPIET
eukprot:4255161-Pyramimonas_sp.AAC.1